MSAETLRAAARLMRERVQNVKIDSGLKPEAHVSEIDWFGATDGYGTLDDLYDGVHAHLSSWHPAVAHAVADWLDNAAEDLEMQEPHGDLRKQWDMRVHINGDHALAVARAYLGETA